MSRDIILPAGTAAPHPDAHKRMDPERIKAITMAMAEASATKGGDPREILAASAIMVGTLIKNYWPENRRAALILVHASNVKDAASD